MQFATECCDDFIYFDLVLPPFRSLFYLSQLWIVLGHGNVVEDPHVFPGFVLMWLIELLARYLEQLLFFWLAV
jgi:hypothetical protein